MSNQTFNNVFGLTTTHCKECQQEFITSPNDLMTLFCPECTRKSTECTRKSEKKVPKEKQQYKPSGLEWSERHELSGQCIHNKEQCKTELFPINCECYTMFIKWYKSKSDSVIERAKCQCSNCCNLKYGEITLNGHGLRVYDFCSIDCQNKTCQFIDFGHPESRFYSKTF
jgi:hypothetical protein